MRKLMLTVLLAALPGTAWAGCGDSLVFRIDWAEKLSFEEVKLHGAYAWEASPDGWVTHPIGGKELGFVHLSCPTPDDACGRQLETFSPGDSLVFSGQFQSQVRPSFVYPEGAASTASQSPWPTVASGLSSPVFNAAQALPKNEEPGPRHGCSTTAGGFTLLALAALLRRRGAPRRRGVTGGRRRCSPPTC